MIYENNTKTISLEKGERVFLSNGKTYEALKDTKIRVSNITYNKKGQIVVDIDADGHQLKKEEFLNFLYEIDEENLMNSEMPKDLSDIKIKIHKQMTHTMKCECGCWHYYNSYKAIIDNRKYTLLERVEYNCYSDKGVTHSYKIA